MFAEIKKYIEKHWDLVLYFVFGVLTTFVNYLVYLPMYNYFHVSAALSNSIAWVVSVLFAFLTNKPFVFKSMDWSASIVVPEILKFVSCRFVSGILETLILLVTVDIMQWNGNLWKVFTMVFVVVANYIGSKLFVFRNKK